MVWPLLHTARVLAGVARDVSCPCLTVRQERGGAAAGEREQDEAYTGDPKQGLSYRRRWGGGPAASFATSKIVGGKNWVCKCPNLLHLTEDEKVMKSTREKVTKLGGDHARFPLVV